MGQATTQPGRASPYTKEELVSFDLYAALRQLRQAARRGMPPSDVTARLRQIAAGLELAHPSDWLIALEILEIARQSCDTHASEAEWLKAVGAHLERCSQSADTTTRKTIARGLALAEVPDDRDLSPL